MEQASSQDRRSKRAHTGKTLSHTHSYSIRRGKKRRLPAPLVVLVGKTGRGRSSMKESLKRDRDKQTWGIVSAWRILSLSRARLGNHKGVFSFTSEVMVIGHQSSEASSHKVILFLSLSYSSFGMNRQYCGWIYLAYAWMTDMGKWWGQRLHPRVEYEKDDRLHEQLS